MYKGILLVVGMSLASGISASENQNDSTGAPDSLQATSYVTRIVSCVKANIFATVALAGLGAYGLYTLATRLIHQEEERIFEEHEQPESYLVTKKDYDMVCALIDAMEKDMVQFDAQPSRVKSMAFDTFDNVEMANGCEGMRNVFCTLYEQCVQEPDNKLFLQEIITIFKQTVEENMVVA